MLSFLQTVRQYSPRIASEPLPLLLMPGLSLPLTLRCHRVLRQTWPHHLQRPHHQIWPLCLQTLRHHYPLKVGTRPPTHTHVSRVSTDSPDQTPGDSSVSDTSLKPKELWALGDPVFRALFREFRALFREHRDNHRQPRENHGQPSTEDHEATSLLPMAILEFTKLTIKCIINLLIQKHRQDICQQHEVSHPSQICHSCIFTLEKYYFFRYYDVLCKRF